MRKEDLRKVTYSLEGWEDFNLDETRRKENNAYAEKITQKWYVSSLD